MQQKIDKLNQSVDSSLILLQNLENQDEVTSIFNQNSYEEPKLTHNESSRQNIRSLKNYTHKKSKSNFKSLGSKIKISKKKEKEE